MFHVHRAHPTSLYEGERGPVFLGGGGEKERQKNDRKKDGSRETSKQEIKIDRKERSRMKEDRKKRKNEIKTDTYNVTYR